MRMLRWLWLLTGTTLALHAQAAVEPASAFEFEHKLTVQGGYGPRESRIGQEREDYQGLRYEPSLTWYAPDRDWPRWQGFTRLWLSYNSSQTSGGLLEEEQQQTVEGFNAELREFYLRRNLLADDPRLSVSLGRQKFSDHFGIWWDDSIESLRLDFDDTFSRGFVAAGQRLLTYNSEESELQPGEESILYLMSSYGVRWSENNWAGVRLLLEDDHSAAEVADNIDYSGTRAGLYFHGANLRGSPLSDYHVELAMLEGEYELLAANGTSSSDHATGWALVGDIGTRFHQWPGRPRLALRLGITDAPDKARDGFFLNRIQSDRVTSSATYTSGLIGTFLALDLRNVQFVGLLLETRPADRTWVDVRLFDLHRRSAADTLPIRVIEQDMAGDSDHIGQVLDLNYYWRMFPLAYRNEQIQMNLLVSAGWFRSGNAIRDPDHDFQFSVGMNLRY